MPESIDILLTDIRDQVASDRVNEFSLGNAIYQEVRREILNNKLSLEKREPNITRFVFLTGVARRDFELSNKLLPLIAAYRGNAAKLCLARYYALGNKYAFAHKLYFELINDGVQLPSVTDFTSIVTASLAIGNFADAERSLTLGLQKYPESTLIRLVATEYQTANMYRVPKYRDDAEKNFTFLKNQTDITTTGYENLGRLGFDLGHIDEGYNYLRRSINLLQPAVGYKTDNHFDVLETTKTMQDLISKLADAGLDTFLAFGTLLGFIREGTVLGHDKDADIGVICEDPKIVHEALRKVCKGSSYTAPTMFIGHPDANEWNIPVLNYENGVGIDIFIFRRTRDMYRAGLSRPYGDLMWEFQPFALTQQTISGFEYNIPANVNSHLAELYGFDWRTSKPLWDSLVECPNLLDLSRNVSLFFCFNRLGTAIVKGDEKKVDYYLYWMKNRWNYEFTVNELSDIKSKLMLAHESSA